MSDTNTPTIQRYVFRNDNGVPDHWAKYTDVVKLQAEHAAAMAEKEFQSRVKPWLMECFGAEIANNQQERNHRFIEESLELIQACGATASEAHQLVEYVFNRPPGEKPQEAGGVMVTLAALCLSQGLDMHACGEVELARIWTKVEKIRDKQAAKPKHSPLPVADCEGTKAPAAKEAECEELRSQMELEFRQCREAFADRDREIAELRERNQSLAVALNEKNQQMAVELPAMEAKIAALAAK